jgi:hypothetical protein
VKEWGQQFPPSKLENAKARSPLKRLATVEVCWFFAILKELVLRELL